MDTKYAVSLLLFAALVISAIAYPPDGDSRNAGMLSSGGGLPVISSEAEYFGEVTGFFARPEAPGTYPGVVMIHEWWGLNKNIRIMAEELASEGYLVLAADLFSSVAQTPDEARAQVSALDQEEATANLRSAVSYLQSKGAFRIASLGWCFGGGQSLQLALSGENLAATVIYYGQLTADQEALSLIRWPVLGIFGAEDSSIPIEDIWRFQRGLEERRTAVDIHVYPDVGHAFANPSGANYAPEATRDAWEKTLTFLRDAL
ncbi:MAG: dienelactone hydrolase family protein [bacterium]|nr:dienelactone hydrolase family protein [bacterium]